MGVVSVEGLEPSTNGLKGQKPYYAASIQWPAVFFLVHWTIIHTSTLDALYKVVSTLKRPMDLLYNNYINNYFTNG